MIPLINEKKLQTELCGTKQIHCYIFLFWDYQNSVLLWVTWDKS